MISTTFSTRRFFGAVDERPRGFDGFVVRVRVDVGGNGNVLVPHQNLCDVEWDAGLLQIGATR